MTDLNPSPQQVELLVCTTCRNGDPVPDAPRAGRVLLDALLGAPIDGVTVRAVECLSNCSRGCTVALRAVGRWTYVYGNLDAAQHLDTVRDGALKYRDAPDGLVPWRDRPEHFRKNCIARIPPMEAPNVA